MESKLKEIVRTIAEETGKRAREALLSRIVETAKEKERTISLYRIDASQPALSISGDGDIFYLSSKSGWERVLGDIEELSNLPEISKVLNELLIESNKVVASTY